MAKRVLQIIVSLYITEHVAQELYDDSPWNKSFIYFSPFITLQENYISILEWKVQNILC